jgi:hypothetical protein
MQESGKDGRMANGEADDEAQGPDGREGTKHAGAAGYAELIAGEGNSAPGRRPRRRATHRQRQQQQQDNDATVGARAVDMLAQQRFLGNGLGGDGFASSAIVALGPGWLQGCSCANRQHTLLVV